MPVPDSIAKPTFNTDEQTNASASITLPANAKGVNVVNSIDWSFSATPASAEVTVTIGGAVTWRVDVTAAGPGSKSWKKGIYGDENQAVVVTLTSGGIGIVGNINVESRLI